MIILDIGNVWTAHNNNTTLQRIEKTIIRSAAWYGGIELGKLGVTAGISTAPYIGAAGGVFLGAGIAFGGNALLNRLENQIYDWLDIE